MIQYKAKGIGAADEGIQSILNERYNEVKFLIKLENVTWRCKKIGTSFIERDNVIKNK